MEKKFSRSWNSSKKPRKQRKYRHNAPLHIRQKFMTAHLSKELQQKYGKKRIPLRKGDTVKIMIGQFKKKTGKVTKVNLRKERIYVENIHHAKRDGSKSFYPLHPSNVLITELYTEDKKRIKKWEGKNGTHQKTSRAKDMADREKKT